MQLSENSIWYRATTLAERLTAGIPSDATEPAVEDDLARYRLQSWKSQSPFNEGAYFEQRLALDGLTETQLRHLLIEPIEVVWERFAPCPAWLAELQAALSHHCEIDLQPLLSDRLKSNPTTGFLMAAVPFIAQAMARFDAGVARLTARACELPFDPSSIKKILFAHLPDHLLTLMNRTMALELNIARLNGELAGDSPEERFQSFIARLSRPEHRRSFWQEYPVLARLLVEQTQRWVSVSLEFLTRLCRDWDAIRATFALNGNAGDPVVLVSVKGGIADTHRGGHSVFIAKFSSGFRLVYKPKALGVDVHFQQLLQWVNACGAEMPFPILTILNRETYGWVEYAAARECQTTEEVRRFYRRTGGYLALLYLLDATDFHSGNLIAAGEFPYLIDLEALFHPHRSHTSAPQSADDLARRAISHSVQRIGLLPERAWSNSGHAGIDRSGLGTVDNQITPHPRPQWEMVGTDTMHLVRKQKPVGADKNRPRLAGSGVDVLDYRDEILAGFTSTYSLLLSQKEELLSDAGPLMRFAEDEVCVFLRSMRTYRYLLRESHHPDVLRDAIDRDRLFDMLWAEVESDPDLAKVIQIEREELLRGDIPLFTTRPTSQDLWVNATDRIPDFFAEPSLSIVRRRLAQLGPEDHDRQTWLIQASLATMPTAQSAPISAPLPVAMANNQRLRQAAQAVGDRLEKQAFRGSEDASWMGLMGERERHWSIAPLGLDVEAGLPGVALFLAYLGVVTEEDRYTTLARSALKMMQLHIQEWGDNVELIGSFDGWGGIIYTLTHLGILWQRPDLLSEAEAIVARLPALIEQDDSYDIFGGAAGCIMGLHCLAQFAPSDRLTNTAIQCGDHLLKQARQMTEGIGWPSQEDKLRPAVGFVYGTAGIAWALMILHNWTGLDRFRAAAYEALRYERSLFDEATEDWAGIGLARLCWLSCADDPALHADIQLALATTLQRGFGQHHSLQQGDAGNLEFLLQASRKLGTSEWEPQLRNFSSVMLASIEQHGWRCGTPLAVETPGLLQGLAGIGYQLLRLAEPELVPSVLMLEPPATRRMRDEG